MELCGDLLELSPGTRELPASSTAAGALTRAWKACGEQRTAETKHPPAASPKALSSPLQAAKKQMKDSSVGHQALRGAQGVPQTAPSRGMARQGYATLQPSPPLSETRQHPGAHCVPSCSTHTLRRSGSNKAVLHGLSLLPSPSSQAARCTSASTISYPQLFCCCCFQSARCSEQKFP